MLLRQQDGVRQAGDFHQLLADILADGMQQGIVPFQQLERHPPAVQAAGQRPLQQRLQLLDSGFDRLGIADFRGVRFLPGDHPRRRVHQLIQPFPAAGAGAHHRHAEILGQLVKINADILFLGLVHQVDADHHPVGDLHGLQHQVQVALQAGGVADHHDAVRPAEADKIPGHLFLRGMRHEGICTGDIHQNGVHPLMGVVPLGVGNGFSRPIAGMLIQAGQLVEHGAFPHVGVARQGDDLIAVLPLDEKPFIRRAPAGGTRC